MKYVIGFGAICVISGLAATFWLWWYAERSISLMTSPASRTDGNGIAQPLLAGEHGSGGASQQRQDIHPADAIEAQQEARTHSVATPPSVFDGGGAVTAPGAEEQQEKQRKDSDSSSRTSSPPIVETLAGETTLEGAKGQEASLDPPTTLQPPEESTTTSASQDNKQKQQESNGSNGNTSSNLVASVGDDGDSQDPPAVIEGNSAGAGTEELGKPEEVPSSGESATER